MKDVVFTIWPEIWDLSYQSLQNEPTTVLLKNVTVSGYAEIISQKKNSILDTVQKYIDFSNNEELKKEVSYMDGLGMSILEEGIERGIEQGIEEGMERGKAVQIVASVNNLMESLHLTLQDACKALGLQQKDYEKAKDITR